MKVALIEVSTSHEECLFTQVKLLTDGGHTVDLILHHALQPQIRAYQDLCNHCHFFEPVTSGFFKKLRQRRALTKMLKSYDLLIFNTASSSKLVRNLALSLSRYPVRCLGVLHNAKKLGSSFTQRLISLKIKRYLVLSDTLLENAPKMENLILGSFYPIYFPTVSAIPKKEEKEIWISIPGRIDWERRAYTTLISALRGLKTNVPLKFLLLGKLDKTTEAGNRLWQLILENQLEHFFICFDTFISNEKYHGHLKTSDYIMPLLKTSEDYLNFKISGSFNLAFAYKKTLLCSSFFEPLQDLKENGLFYQENALQQLLHQISNENLMKKGNYAQDKWDYAYQKEKYLKFVEGK